MEMTMATTTTVVVDPLMAKITAGSKIIAIRRVIAVGTGVVMAMTELMALRTR